MCLSNFKFAFEITLTITIQFKLLNPSFLTTSFQVTSSYFLVISFLVILFHRHEGRCSLNTIRAETIDVTVHTRVRQVLPWILENSKSGKCGDSTRFAVGWGSSVTPAQVTEKAEKLSGRGDQNPV